MPETSIWSSSGSRSSASDVNPTKSAKSTVTRRRSWCSVGFSASVTRSGTPSKKRALSVSPLAKNQGSPGRFGPASRGAGALSPCRGSDPQSLRPREEVALGSHLSMHELLGWHVCRRSHAVSELYRSREGLGEREVEEPRWVAHGDVVRFDVEMQDVIGVHVMECGQHSDPEETGFRD